MSRPADPPRRGMLTTIAAQLSPRDQHLLGLLTDYRYATTGQLARLIAHEHVSITSAVRQAGRSLRRLDSHQLARALPRRIGGIRSGSAGHIWTPTSRGARLHAQLSDSFLAARWRNTDPADGFIAHHLAITDLRVQLAELAATGQIVIESIQTEPQCWRRSPAGAHQVATWLKPDLAAVTTAADGYEDSWFLEADMATQTPARIITKSRAYAAYRRTGREQAGYGVFPAVVWITTTAKRAATLAQRITDEPELDERLFTVITPEEFKQLILAGAADFPTTALPDRPP